MSFTHRDPPKSKLIADAMLGSLARKLRAFGFDTSYYRGGEDSGLIRLATSEGRIILSSDRSLVGRARAHEVAALLISGRTEGKRISSLKSGAIDAGLPLTRGEARCSMCNGNLERVPRAKVKGQVPPPVETRHRVFYRCLSCGKYYWRGSHWKKLRWLERRLRETRHGAFD
jgi:uncharacterized protein